MISAHGSISLFSRGFYHPPTGVVFFYISRTETSTDSSLESTPFKMAIPEGGFVRE